MNFKGTCIDKNALGAMGSNPCSDRRTVPSKSLSLTYSMVCIRDTFDVVLLIQTSKNCSFAFRYTHFHINS